MEMTPSEPDNEEINHLLSLLREQYQPLLKIAEETFHSLGKEKAGHFTYLANDCIDIIGAISEAYPNEISSSLTQLYLYGLFKEVYWFELLFLAGNYPLLNRSLRYVWEMIFRAYYVDTYERESPEDPEPPGATSGDKAEWLRERGRKISGWKNFMRKILVRLLPQAPGTEMDEFYKEQWDKLNEYVHPSTELLYKMASDVSDVLITDRFDKKWALETIRTTTVIFDLVWLAVISKFPDCAVLLAQKGLHLEYPIVTSVLRKSATEE